MYNFTIAKLENFDDFYKIKSEPNSVYWSGFDKAPDYASFKEYYEKELSRKDRTIILLSKDSDDSVVGYVAIDDSSIKQEVEISYGVLSKVSGQGLGKKLVEYANNYVKEHYEGKSKIIAWIADSNLGSIKVVISNGYSQTDEFEYREFKQEEDKVKFDKYVLSLKN